MKLTEFMIQSPTGKTHAINPKTMKTYCGHPNLVPTAKLSELSLEDIGWRFLDVVPSDTNQPTCKICVNHYDDPLRKQLSNLARDLRTQVSEFLCTCLDLKNVGALGRFAENLAHFLRAERKLREKERRTQN